MPMRRVFAITAKALVRIATLTNFSYNEINILVYYLLIPLSWTIMGDLIVKLPIFTGIVAILWTCIFIATRHKFSTWCDEVFDDSVRFLCWFRNIGWDYITASVIICVIIPLMIYLALILLILGYDL